MNVTGQVNSVIYNNTFHNCDEGILIIGDDNYSWGRAISPGTALLFL